MAQQVVSSGGDLGGGLRRTVLVIAAREALGSLRHGSWGYRFERRGLSSDLTSVRGNRGIPVRLHCFNIGDGVGRWDLGGGGGLMWWRVYEGGGSSNSIGGLEMCSKSVFCAWEL